MEDNFAFQEKLRAYTSGALPPDEREKFFAEIQATDAGRQELAFSEQLVASLREREIAQVSGIISGIILEEGLPEYRKVFSNRVVAFFTILGLAFGLAVLGYIIVKQVSGKPDPVVGISERHIKPLENVFALPASAAGLQEGLAEYERGQYKPAAAKLAAYLAQEQELNVALYLGTALLLDDRAKEAIRVLEEAVLSNEQPVRETAIWYLCLAYLKSGKPHEAIDRLRMIEPQALYYTEAQQLLADLKSLQ